MKALFELFRRFDARRIFGFIRRLGGMSRPKVKCYDLRSTRALRVEGDLPGLVGTGGGKNFYPRPPGGGRQQKRTKFSSVFAQKGEEFASLRRGKREFAGGVLKRTNFGF